MSKIVINMYTEKDTADISIDVKAECSLNELEVAVGTLMGKLASSSTTGLQVLRSLMDDIEEAAAYEVGEDDGNEVSEQNN